MRAALRWRVPSICLTIVVMVGSSFAGTSAQSEVVQRSECVVEVEPNDDISRGVAFEGEGCISGTLVEVGDTDTFIWDVDEEAAATKWSLALEGIPLTVTTVSLVRVDSEPGVEILHLDAGPADADLATTDVSLEEGRYAFVVTRQEPAGGAELSEERGYELHVVHATTEETASPTANEGGSGRVVVVATDGIVPRLGPKVAVELLLDTSGSMRKPLGRSTRIAVAKRTLVDLVDELSRGTPVALRTFKAKAKSCATVLPVPLEPLEPQAMKRTIREQTARKGTKTPIAKALEKVPSDLRGAEGHRVVVLVTDGEEDCGGDPAAAIVALADAGYTSTVHLIGYSLDEDAELSDTLSEWAALGGGRYLEAPDRASLAKALETATTAPYLVFDEDGVLVAQGLVGDAGVEIDAGVYRIEVLGEPPTTFEAVELEAGAVVQLPVGADAAAE